MFVDFHILNELGSPSINSNTFANRPPAGQIGRLFVSTDTYEIYRDNGSTWDLIGGPGSSTVTGTGAATQVAYWTASQAIGGSNNLWWDNTNKHLGIGISTPSGLIHADGGASAARMILDADAGVARIFSFRSDNLPRWAFRVDGAETGSNAGADLAVRAYNDAGAFTFAPLTIARATGKAIWQATEAYTTGIARGNYFDYNLSVSNGGSFSSPNSISAVGATLDLTLAGNATIPSGARSGLDAYNTVSFTGTGTLTHSQGTQIRAYSNLTTGWAFAGSATGTITHLAGLRVLFPDNSGSSVTVTNNYGLLINDQTANTGTVIYTNRWGIYQEGSSDLNYMAANLLLGSTVNTGEKLQVTGNATISSICKANQFIVGTPTDLTRSFAASGNANSIALWLEEYGNTVNSADIFFNKGRGTDIAKLPVLVGDNLGAISFCGYVNNTFISSLNIDANVTNIDSVNNQANADFIITQSYNSPTRTENFRIIANGGNADIRGSVTAAGFIPDSNTIPTNGMYLYSTNTLGFSTNSANILTLNTIGLGIFTTASYCIDVTNNSSGSFSTIRANNGFIGSSDGSQILLGNSQNFTNAYFRLNGGGNTSQSGAGSLNIGVTESSPIGFYTANTIRATITSGGNFLVNSIIDNGLKFQVAGDMYSTNELYLDNGKYIRFQRTSGGLYIQTLGILSGTDDVALITTGDFYLRNGSAQNLIKTTNAGNSEFLGNIKTGAPTTGTAATWKLGQRVAAAVVLDATQYIEVEVGGTFYKLAIVN